MIYSSLIQLLFALLSIVLCVIAPSGYSAAFCQTIGWAFLLQNLCYFVLNKSKNIVGIEFFFAIAFFFVNFCYPLFYYVDRPNFGFFWMHWNHALLNRATAIAYMGYAFYMVGLVPWIRMRREEPQEVSFTISSNQYVILFILSVLSFVCYVCLGGWQALQAVYRGEGSLRQVGLYSYFYAIFTLGSGLLAIFVFLLKRQQWWFYLLTLGIALLLILSTGSRSFVLSIGLILMVGWHNRVRCFRWFEILGIVVVGTVLLYLLQHVRSYPMAQWAAVISTLQLKNVLDVFEDLMLDGRNLYVLVDYGMTHSYTWFHGMLVDVFSFVPGSAGLLVRWTGEPYETLSSQDFTTYLRLGENAQLGLGCNMIGDAFRSFGYVGTALTMFMIGWCTKEAYYRSTSNVYMYVVYYLMVSYSVFYTRAGILFPPRLIIWSLCIVWLIITITENTRFHRIIRRWIGREDGVCD